MADPSSFRPLGMIDSTGKLFKRLILNRIENVCQEEDNEGISAAQFGFRKGLSTHHALKKVEERVSEALHELPSPGGFCAIIALDVKNAFNSATWECIYQSLAQEKKMPQYLLRIMDSYLKDRNQTIVTEEGTIATDLSARVLQGSIKGPFLWTCMYDGLLRMKLPNGASLLGFADDLVLLVVAEKAWLVEIIADEALDLIAEWLISRYLQLTNVRRNTVRKCEAILVTRRRKYEAPRFEINREAIPLKQEIKYLVVWLDSKWSFKHHVKQAATKASITCTSLMRLMPNVGRPWPARRQLLATVVESIQLYGAPTWGDCIPAYLVDKHMGAVQRKMNLRIISGCADIVKRRGERTFRGSSDQVASS